MFKRPFLLAESRFLDGQGSGFCEGIGLIQIETQNVKGNVFAIR